MVDPPPVRSRQLSKGLYLWYTVLTAVPMLLLGSVAYFEVQSNLSDGAERDLRRQSKVVAMQVFRNLKAFESELTGETLPSKAPDRPQRTVVRTRATDNGEVAVELLPAGSNETPRAVAVPPHWLQIPEDLVRHGVSYCVADDRLRPVLCSGTELNALLAQLPGDGRDMTAANWRAQVAGEPAFLAYWQLFLRSHFDAPDWLIIASRSERDVFAPLEDFQRLYPRLLVLVILVALLLASLQLRSRLTPLHRLVKATEQFVQGSYDARVAVQDTDEIGTLSSCFNQIAEHTELQFKRLRALSNLDRTTLLSPGEQRIIEMALTEAMALVDGRRATFVNLGDPVNPVATTDTPDPGQPATQPVKVSADTLRWFGSLTGPVATRLHPITSSDEPLAEPISLVPIIQHEHPIGVLIIDGADVAASCESIESLIQFGERFVLALSNAHWEQELFRQAHYDVLTGLPNRVLLDDRLRQAMRQVDRTGGSCAVLFMDLDGFKAVNDSLGHEVGDAYLVAVARRLEEATRSVDSVMRFGGDEFVILAGGLDRSDRAVPYLGEIASRLIEAVSETIEIDDYSIALGASIGIAVYPDDGADVSELLRNADTAMYHAKAEGRGRVSLFQAKMNEDARDRLALRQAFVEAINTAQEQLSIEYQPQVETNRYRIAGAEALVRWRHPERGLIPPSVFVQLAEESGLILKLGEWVLRTACSDIQALREQGINIPRVSVNVSVQQFLEPNFPELVDKVLTETGLPHDVLELEVTEQILMKNSDSGQARLQALSDQGIKLALDDFGTGYSSLAYLQHLPLDALKIDRCFVVGLGDDGPSDAIVTTTVTLGKTLGLRLVAEGVDDRTQFDVLRRLQCDEIQGFLFSRPVSIEALAALCRKRLLMPSYRDRRRASVSH